MSANLPEHGGEGKGDYKGNKSNSNLPQHGGEGGGVPGGSGGTGWTPAKSPNESYTGPGRSLKAK